MKKLVLGEDYYINGEGLLVFTESFLKKRGFCCHNGCQHCPYKDCFCHKKSREKEQKES